MTCWRRLRDWIDASVWAGHAGKGERQLAGSCGSQCKTKREDTSVPRALIVGSTAPLVQIRAQPDGEEGFADVVSPVVAALQRAVGVQRGDRASTT